MDSELRKIRWQLFSVQYRRVLKSCVGITTWWAIEQANAREFLRQFNEHIHKQKLEQENG